MASMTRRYSVGVSVGLRFFTTFGSSVSEDGLKAMMRSRTARRKTECSITWYLRMLAGDKPVPAASVDPCLDVRGQDLAHRPLPEERVEVPVEVSHITRPGRGLQVPAG